MLSENVRHVYECVNDFFILCKWELSYEIVEFPSLDCQIIAWTVRPYCVGWEDISVIFWGPFDLQYCTYMQQTMAESKSSITGQQSIWFLHSCITDMDILCIIYKINNQISFGYFGCAYVGSCTTHAFPISVQLCPIIAVTSEATCFIVSTNQ